MVIKVVAIHDGVEPCHVGFLPRHIIAHAQQVNCLHRKFAQVLEQYDNNEVGLVRKNMSICNHGTASYNLLDDGLEGSLFFITKLK